MYDKLTREMAELEETEVLKEVENLYAQGVPALDILTALQKGMEEVGKRFQEKEYFLSELIMSAEVFKDASKIFDDTFSVDSSKKLGKMVMGTVKDDVHDIGKNIVVTILRCNGFEVIDLGVDVPHEKFIEAIREHNPQFIGMSCLLTSAFESMRDAIAAIDAAGLREGRKILIGGGPIDQKVCEYVKADAFCRTAQEAVTICTLV